MGPNMQMDPMMIQQQMAMQAAMMAAQQQGQMQMPPPQGTMPQMFIPHLMGPPPAGYQQTMQAAPGVLVPSLSPQMAQAMPTASMPSAAAPMNVVGHLSKWMTAGPPGPQYSCGQKGAPPVVTSSHQSSWQEINPVSSHETSYGFPELAPGADAKGRGASDKGRGRGRMRAPPRRKATGGGRATGSGRAMGSVTRGPVKSEVKEEQKPRAPLPDDFNSDYTYEYQYEDEYSEEGVAVKDEPPPDDGAPPMGDG